MSVLDFRIRRGGALLCEMAEEGDLIAPDPVESISREVQDDILNDIDQFSDEVQDRFVKIVDSIKPEQAPSPSVLRAINQYDGIECFSKLIIKISPIYDRVNALKDLKLDVSQKSDMLHVLDQIQETTCSISNNMIPMLSKMNFMINFLDNDTWHYKDIYSALGFITMNMQEIISKGLTDITYSRRSSNILNMISDAGINICKREDIIRKNVIAMNDLIDDRPSHGDSIYIYRNMNLDHFIESLLNTETVLNIIKEKQITTSIENVIDLAKRHCYSSCPTVCDSNTSFSFFMENLSSHIRWIMTESYSMLCDLSGDVPINQDVFLNMSMRLCAAVCNIFYLCTLVLFECATEISKFVADNDAILQQISRIKHEVIKV